MAATTSSAVGFVSFAAIRPWGRRRLRDDNKNKGVNSRPLVLLNHNSPPILSLFSSSNSNSNSNSNSYSSTRYYTYTYTSLSLPFLFNSKFSEIIYLFGFLFCCNKMKGSHIFKLFLVAQASLGRLILRLRLVPNPIFQHSVIAFAIPD